MNFQYMWRKIEDHYIVILAIWLFVYVLWKWWTGRSKIYGISYKRVKFRFFHFFLTVSAVIYAVLFLYVTLLSREFQSELKYELSFLWEYRLAFGFSEGKCFVRSITWVRQIRDNILLFVPMGVLYGEMAARCAFLIGSKSPTKCDARLAESNFQTRSGKGTGRAKSCRPHWYAALMSGFLISLTIELVQLVFHLGLFEFDDMFNNTIGMGLGYGFFAFWRWVCNAIYRPRHKRREKTQKETSARGNVRL